MTHAPDILSIPGPLQSLNWHRVTEAHNWFDGEIIMFAVPICDRADKPKGNWQYQIDVVTIHVDGDEQHATTSYTVDGNPWGFDPMDADWYMVVRP